MAINNGHYEKVVRIKIVFIGYFHRIFVTFDREGMECFFWCRDGMKLLAS